MNNLPDTDQVTLAINELPVLMPRFYVPPLADKPQNPIMDGLKFASIGDQPWAHSPQLLPPELTIIVDDFSSLAAVPNLSHSIWTDAAKRKGGGRSQIRSWDALRSSHGSSASPTSFLSEQSPPIFASAQYHVQPIQHNPIYVSQHELLKSLKMTVLGTSSALHTWDPVSETFIGKGGRNGVVLIDGKNEVISESFMRGFLTIGTLLRRLEILVSSLRTKQSQAGPTLHAFAHALLSVITHLRKKLAKSPPTNVGADFQTRPYMLSAISMHYTEYESAVVALGSLCNRDATQSPHSYSTLSPYPAPLLSLIYTHLNTHMERQSPVLITAYLAYILNTTSSDYLQGVCRSIGLGVNTSLALGKGKKVVTASDMFEDDEGEDDDLFEEMEMTGKREEFPSFFGEELAEALITARRSLMLLRTAKPDHHLLVQQVGPRKNVEWLWTEEEVEAAWTGHVVGASPRTREEELADMHIVRPCSVYKPELATQFSLFDLEPGSLVPNLGSVSSPVQDFVSRFPSSLPSLTPTLEHLKILTFNPLVSHASSLSRALLSLFLSPSPTTNVKSKSNLNFIDHLTLLRSYILLTSPAFKSRLAAALFSNSGEFDIDHDPRSRARNSRRQGQDKANSEQTWAVGLAPALTDRESWPPGGADLSFLLRTVIVDSLDLGRGTGEEEKESGEFGVGVWEEAEYRLGFAIRDLPVGPGRDRWLNPTSIEALDFLYIDYRPPHPLDVLITPGVLSKYQRIFAFILRMMRVEHVTKAFFRMARRNTEQLFPTLTSSNKLLLHFGFIAHSFVTSLSSYVFDTAVGGNFDAFLTRLSQGTSHTQNDESRMGFSDVFALADTHSIVLDNILSACLLRSGQRAVGDLLRGALELVLELGILAGDRKRGRLEEYQAAPLLEDLYNSFRSKMSTLTKVLKALIDKGSTISKLQLEAAMRETTKGDLQKAPGGAESLYHLLIRLDLGDWWNSQRH